MILKSHQYQTQQCLPVDRQRLMQNTKRSAACSLPCGKKSRQAFFFDGSAFKLCKLGPQHKAATLVKPWAVTLGKTRCWGERVFPPVVSFWWKALMTKMSSKMKNPIRKHHASRTPSKARLKRSWPLVAGWHETSVKKCEVIVAPKQRQCQKRLQVGDSVSETSFSLANAITIHLCHFFSMLFQPNCSKRNTSSTSSNFTISPSTHQQRFKEPSCLPVSHRDAACRAKVASLVLQPGSCDHLKIRKCTTKCEEKHVK